MFPEHDRPHERGGRRITLRRFLLGWTVLAFVAWLYAASWGDTDCRETDFVCFSQREVDLIAAVMVGIPWLVGVVIALVAVAVARREER